MTIDAAKERRDRLTVQIEKRLAGSTLAPVFEALQVLRGMGLVAAALSSPNWATSAGFRELSS